MSEFKISLAGQESEFACRAGDTLLRAALRSGVGLPYECNSGGCGSCKFELLEGDVANIWESAPGLSPRDIQKGRKLSCQSIPTTDCTIKVRPDAKAITQFRPWRMSATLSERVMLTADMCEFRFKTERPAQFLPGQFALIDFPGVQGSRGYSMCNLPNEDGEWHFVIKKMPNGKASGLLFEQIKVGDTLEIDGPYGLSYLCPDVPRDIVCVGGGSGLSPVLSIVRAAALDPRMAERKIYLFYGGRGPQDICTTRLIGEDPLLRDRVINYNAVSDAELAKGSDWDGPVCFVHQLVEQTLGDRLKDYEYYFCGPPPMTDALSKTLIMENGVPFDQIHYDRFY